MVKVSEKVPKKRDVQETNAEQLERLKHKQETKKKIKKEKKHRN